MIQNEIGSEVSEKAIRKAPEDVETMLDPAPVENEERLLEANPNIVTPKRQKYKAITSK